LLRSYEHLQCRKIDFATDLVNAQAVRERDFLFDQKYARSFYFQKCEGGGGLFDPRNGWKASQSRLSLCPNQNQTINPFLLCIALALRRG